MQNIKQSQEAAREELKEVNDKLAGLEESGKLQRDRERVEDNIEEVEKDIAERNEEIAGEIAEAGYIPFAMDAVEETGRMLQKNVTKARSPRTSSQPLSMICWISRSASVGVRSGTTHEREMRSRDGVIM